jgi:hypothetical protein
MEGCPVTRYAENTKVSSDKSRNEIETTLRRYGATSFAYGWTGDRAQIGFHLGGRAVRFDLPMPDRGADEFRFTPARRIRRSPEEWDAAYDQAVRQRWRGLALVIKAKLEAVEAGITTLEEEFLAHIALPSGSTVGEWLRPQLDEAYSNNRMPQLMAGAR